MKRISIVLFFQLALAVLVACGGAPDAGEESVVLDTTPPVTVSPLALESVSHQGVTLSVGIDEVGFGYYRVQSAATPLPSIAAMLEGSFVDFAALETNVFDVHTLLPSTDYRVYFVAADRAGNVQAELQSLAFRTLAAPDLQAPAFRAWGISNRTESGGTFGARINEAGKVFYLVQLASEAAPTQQDILAAASMDMLPEEWSYAEISGLASASDYRVYFLAQDTAGNTNAQSLTTSLQTLAPLYVEFGGLQWMPNFIGPWLDHEANWSTADSYCRNTEINGATGWRLPTVAELQALAASDVTLRVPYWQKSGYTWAGDRIDSNSHWAVALSSGSLFNSYNSNQLWVSCVRASD